MLNDVAQPRAAFFLSDRTGITVEILGHSLLRQFEDVPFEEITLPYLDTREKAVATVEQINARAGRDGATTACVQHHCKPGNSTRY